MRIGTPVSGISLTFRAAEKCFFPSMGLDIAISCLGFAGQNDGVWFSKEDLECFVSDLREFEKLRQGSVRLESVGKQSEYCEFRLELFSTSKSGAMAVKAKLLKIHYLDPGYKDQLFPLKIEVAFDVDSGLLNNIITDFEDLLKSVEW